MKKKRIIIGLTGYIAAGKGIAADLLKNEFGFTHYAFVDRVREAAYASGHRDTSREVLQEVGSDMQKRFGGDIFAKMIAGIMWAEQPERAVIEAIRNPQEYAFLAQHTYFLMLAITAPFELRFARMCLRKRPGDPKTIDEFYAIDQRDRGIGQDLLETQVDRCVGLADYTLENKGTREEFEIQIRDLLAIL